MACRYDAAAGTHAFETIATNPAAVHDLLIDALELAKLAASDQLPTVHVPRLAVRQHRSLIRHRHALIDRRTGDQEHDPQPAGCPGSVDADALARSTS